LRGARDLLLEGGIARESTGLEEAVLESMVTNQSAALLRLSDRGSLTVGALADLVVLPAGVALSKAARADIALVVIGGKALYADEAYARILAPPEFWTEVRVDGRPKMLASGLAADLAASKCGEPGLQLPDLRWRAA
jgi:adenine deaminase